MDTDDTRTRIPLACEICRRRKRKCDGATPKCSWCLAKNTDCQYVVNTSKKRKHDPNYVASVEAQVELLKEEVRRLEDLIQASTRVDNISDCVEDDNVTRGEEEELSFATENTREDIIPLNESTAIDDISSLVWRLTIEDSGETTFNGPSGNFCFPVTHQKSTGNQKNGQNIGLSANDAGTEISLPDDPRIVNDLVDLFARFINPVQQFVDQQTITNILNDSGTSPNFLKCAIMAAGALLSNDSKGNNFGNEMATYAEVRVLQTCRQHPSPETVQALSILCWRELGLDQDNMAWMYNSMAASLAVHLGLTVSSLDTLKQVRIGDVTGTMNSESQSLRLRALWSTVFIDRIATSFMGRHCVTPWRRVQASGFLNATSTSPSVDEVVFDHHCRLWFVLDQFLDNIYSFQFNRLKVTERLKMLLEGREQLLAFYRNLDPRLQLRKGNNPVTVIFFHMSYNMSQIMIHRPYLKEPVQSTAHRLSIRSMSAAATAIVRLIGSYEKMGTFDLVPPFLVHNVLSAAITLLLTATSTQATIRNQSISRLRVCLSALEAMGTRWPRAKRGIIVIRQLAQRWKIAMALPMCYSFPLPTGATVDNDSELGQATHIDDTSEIYDAFAIADGANTSEEASTWDFLDAADFVNYGLLDLSNLPFFDDSSIGGTLGAAPSHEFFNWEL